MRHQKHWTEVKVKFQQRQNLVMQGEFLSIIYYPRNISKIKMFSYLDTVDTGVLVGYVYVSVVLLKSRQSHNTLHITSQD